MHTHIHSILLHFGYCTLHNEHRAAEVIWLDDIIPPVHFSSHYPSLTDLDLRFATLLTADFVKKDHWLLWIKYLLTSPPS